MDNRNSEARRTFLVPIMEALKAMPHTGLHVEFNISSLVAYADCLLVSSRRHKEVVHVLAASVEEGAVRRFEYQNFPGVGKPHYVAYFCRRRFGTSQLETGERLVSPDAQEIAQALMAWNASLPPRRQLVGEVDLSVEQARLEATGRARHEAAEAPERWVRLEEDLDRLPEWPGASPELLRSIAANFPWRDDGRLPLKEAALLTPVGARGPERERTLWIAAVGPNLRRDPQVITVGPRWLIAENHPHRWDLTPWLWDPRVVTPPEEDRWSVHGLDCSRLTETDADYWHDQPDHPVASAALSILLQDVGRFGEALDLYGIEADEDVWHILNGRSEWRLALSSTLWRLAPWRMRTTLIEEAKHQKAWAAEKRGRRRRLPRLRICPMPGQPYQSKTSLFLTSRDLDGAEPLLQIEDTAWNMRLAEHLWTRPVEIDLRRFGLWKDHDHDPAG